MFRSISARHSLRPLQITERALAIIKSHHNLDTELNGILLAFGDKPRSSEAGLGIIDVERRLKPQKRRVSA